MTANIRRVLRPLEVAAAIFSAGAIAALAAAAAPTITTQPQDQTIAAGSAATLTVEAAGTGTLTYQWYVGESGNTSMPVVGATTASFKTPTLYVGTTYWVRVSDSVGSAETNAASVMMPSPTSGTSRVLLGLGSRAYGAMGDGYGAHPALSPIQVGSDGLSVAAATSVSLFLKTDGTLWQAGGNVAFAEEREIIFNAPAQRQIESGVAKMDTNGDSVYVIKSDASLWRKLGTGYFPVTSNVVDVAAAGGHVLILKSDHSLWAMGANGYGQLGDGTTTDRGSPVLIAQGVKAIGAGARHSLFVKTDNVLWAMGSNGRGQLGDGSTTDRLAPVQVAAGAIAVDGGEDHSVFRKTDGSLWAMGGNDFGQLGDGTTTERHSAVPVATGTDEIAAGSWHTVFKTTDGSLWAMGANVLGALGDGTTIDRRTPILVETAVSAIAAGQRHTLFVKTDGSVWAVGSNAYGELGNGELGLYPTSEAIAADIAIVASADDHTLLLKVDGTLWITGDDSFARTGPPSKVSNADPTLVAYDVVQVSTSIHHVLYVKRDGSLWCYGSNNFGQLGDAAGAVQSEPIQMATGVSMAAAGHTHTAYVALDGGLWTVGANYSGQLGDGTTSSRLAPQEVSNGVVAVAAGTDHTVFLKSDGSAWAMGGNLFGQIGSGTTDASLSPIQVQAAVQAVFAGAYHTLFLRTNGELWGAGSNANGVLGDGSTIDRSTPVLIATDVVDASGGQFNTLYLNKDRELWGMGSNIWGQLIFDWASDSPFDGLTSPVMIAEQVYGADSGAMRSFIIQEVGPPEIIAQPTDQGVESGGAVALSLEVSSVTPPDYQWYRGESGDASLPVPGATSQFFTTPILTNHASYWVRVSNLVGSVDSDTATITVAGPIIAFHPVSMAKTSGGAVTLSIVSSASDGSDVSYQWYFNGEAIEGATSAELTLPSVQSFHAGEYTVEITALGITVLSNSAALTVEAVAPSNARLLNLSTRALALRDSEVLIPGFVIQGSGTKKLLIRAVGPRLGEDPFFVPGVLPDPRMVLKRWNGSSYDDVADNDNWGDNANLDGIIQASAELYAFGLASGSLDAVLLVELAAGQYTVVADDGNGDTGVALVELYDGDADGDTARLINISSRGFVGTGANVMIPGVVISNEGPKTLLLRAVGPTLGNAPFNVPGVLADPVLTVYKGQNPILMNDDWSADPAMEAQTAAVALQVSAFTLPSGSKDAAFVVTLQPGSYTVQASGKDGGTGVALVEVYAVP